MFQLQPSKWQTLLRDPSAQLGLIQQFSLTWTKLLAWVKQVLECLRGLLKKNANSVQLGVPQPPTLLMFQ